MGSVGGTELLMIVGLVSLVGITTGVTLCTEPQAEVGKVVS